MTGIPATRRKCMLADCPYCGGEGDDSTSALGLCTRCHGTGRMTYFLAERVMKRWAAKAAPAPNGVVLHDAVPDLNVNQL
jgi:hypothetical protein